MAAGAWLAPALGTLGGAFMGSNAQSRAAREQRRSTDQAIKLERERDARAEARYQAQVEAQRQAYEQDQALRRQILRSRGIDVPEPRKPGDPKTAPNPAGATGGTLADLLSKRRTLAPPVPGTPTGVPAPTPMEGNTGQIGAGLMDSQGGPAAMGGPVTAPPMMEGGTLGDLSGWSDWRRRI